MMGSITQVTKVESCFTMAMAGPPWFPGETEIRNWSLGHWREANDIITASSLPQIKRPPPLPTQTEFEWR